MKRVTIDLCDVEINLQEYFDEHQNKLSELLDTGSLTIVTPNQHLILQLNVTDFQ